MNDNDNGNDEMVCAAMSILLCPPHEGIAREYQQLSPTQQNQVWSDLTGSEAATLLQTDESPEAIQLAIGELAQEIDKIRSKRKQAFEMAQCHFPDYVNDPSFILRFLRAEQFDPGMTASRLVLHFEVKLELFGPEKLGREIMLSDLEPDDMHSMNMGYFQILPKRDFSGRPVFFYYKAITDCYKRRENIVSFYKVARSKFCMSMVIELTTSLFLLYIPATGGLVHLQQNSPGSPGPETWQHQCSLQQWRIPKKRHGYVS